MDLRKKVTCRVDEPQDGTNMSADGFQEGSNMSVDGSQEGSNMSVDESQEGSNMSVTATRIDFLFLQSLCMLQCDT